MKHHKVQKQKFINNLKIEEIFELTEYLEDKYLGKMVKLIDLKLSKYLKIFSKKL